MLKKDQKTQVKNRKPIKKGAKGGNPKKRKPDALRVRKQRVKDPHQLNRYKDVKGPAYVTCIPTQQKHLITTVNISANWNVNAIAEMQAALTGYFLTKGVLAQPNPNNDLYEIFYDGMFYMWQEFSKQVGGEPTLANRIQIFHDLIKAYEQKSVNKYTFTKVSYGWKDIAPLPSAALTTGWNTWNFVLNGIDNQQYDAPAAIYTPTPLTATVQAYSTFLTMVKAISSDRAHFLKEVRDDAPSVLSRDVSVFSKVYSYLGLNTSAQSGGFYNDIENEVDITAPVLAHTVQYPIQQQDMRVPMKLTVNEGGPATTFAPLVPQYDSWFNKCHLNFKFLDMFEVVNTLVYWYIGAVKKMVTISPNTPMSQYKLPFSQQDFYIVVRQALMNTFQDQWIGQFVGPLQYDMTLTNFLPLQVLGNCYGNDVNKRFLVSTLLSENMAMLQTVTQVQPNRKSQINKVTYIPVWGYYNDVQPTWVLPDDSDTLFTAVPLQATINLVDCTINNTQYVNVNSGYYDYVRSTWNIAIDFMKSVVNVQDMANLSPPSNAAFLQTTRVYGYVDLQFREGLRDGSIKRLPYPCLKNIANVSNPAPPKGVDPKRGSLPKLPPPTTSQNLTIDAFLLTYPPSKEIYELLEYMIVPCIRLDPNSNNDLLNMGMYQTVTGEGVTGEQNPGSTNPAYLARQQESGEAGVQGFGKITSTNIDIVLKKLMEEGKGGFLAGLLGGLVKQIIPGADGIIDTVASLVPI